MKKRFSNVYQFRITLLEITPAIWRRIQVPESYSFWDLHVAIQDAMPWKDCHLHQFEIMNPLNGKNSIIGIPDDEGFDDFKTLSGWKYKIKKYFTMENRYAHYLYDFGDDWHHSIKLEKILPRFETISYPLCIDGKRACPPEDCGSVPGYYELCRIMKDKNHEEYEEMVTWVGKIYNPEYFNINEVRFDDPDQRFKFAFSR